MGEAPSRMQEISKKYLEDLVKNFEKEQRGKMDKDYSTPEGLAQYLHDVWTKQRIDEGWTYGPKRDDVEKKHPDLVPYACLTDSEKELDLNNARETLKRVMVAVKRHGSKAAATAIMARNLAHNIGSHVLAYWIQKLLSDKPADPKQTASLIKYLKQRMDFIADITTISPAWSKNLRINADILSPFIKEQTALLDNIARSEGFSFSTGESVGTGFGFARKKVKSDRSLILRFRGSDYVVAVPHGLVGRQALYAIVENFIRNSAKHGIWSKDTKMKTEDNKKADLVFSITAQYPEKFPDYIKITISDNLENGGAALQGLEEINRLDYVEDSGRIIRGGWGIKEMKLSANFLRQRSVEKLFTEPEEANNPPLLKFETVIEDEQENIAVSFYLRKPKEVCIVSNNERLEGNKVYGIDVLTEDELSKRCRQHKTTSHRFIVFDGPEFAEKVLNEHFEKLPLRAVIATLPSQGNNGVAIRKGLWHIPFIGDVDFSRAKNLPKDFINEIHEKYLASRGFTKSKIYINYQEESGIADEWRNSSPFIRNMDSKRVAALEDRELVNAVIFDQHTDLKKEHAEKIKKTKYYHGVSGSTSFGKLLEAGPPSYKLECDNLVLQWLEAAGTQVAVADERLWHNHRDNAENLKMLGIHLLPIQGASLSEDCQDRIMVDEQYKDIVFFIIHQGLVDKTGDFIEKLINLFPCVVVVSGRGEPENIRQDVWYAPIGAIEDFITDTDKCSLIETLFSLRRTSNGK